MAEEDITSELKSVKQELLLIEDQLQELLEHQQELLQKKDDLEKELMTLKGHVSQAQPSSSKTNVNWDKKDFHWSAELDEKRRSVFKMDSYRPLQLQTMNATLSGEDVLLIMPTGGGKSLCFQLPALVTKGITLVVSPLVSLMTDQVMSLEGRGVKVAMMSAGCSKEVIKNTMAAMTDEKSGMKLLYVTPERLAQSKRFMAKLEKVHLAGRLARVVIDEVHCCSQWGHDFRPDYKILGIIKRQFPGVPILGLTATATTKVLDDVKKMLQLKPDCNIFRASFNRPNLFFEVKPKPASTKESIEDIIKLINSRFKGQSGIIYCFSRKDSEEIAGALSSRGIRAGCYHAYLDQDYRDRIHSKWIKNEIQVVVATIAFGMGIDKPDVMFVIHHSISKSMENYYQESGRAGRNSQRAHCILFYHFSDSFRQSTMVFTEQTGLNNLYGMLAYCIDQKRCRREMIARHFGERWQAAECKQMCDHCASNKAVEMTDVADYAKDLISILESANATKQRVTGLKLVEAWMGKGAVALRDSRVKAPKLPRETCERVISHLLVTGYLKEDFHFTPYSTISYIMPGGKAGILKRGGHQIKMDMSPHLKKVKSTVTATKTAKTSSESVRKPLKANGSSNQIESSKGRNQNDAGASVSHQTNDTKDEHEAEMIVSSSDSDYNDEDNDVTTGGSSSHNNKGPHRKTACASVVKSNVRSREKEAVQNGSGDKRSHDSDSLSDDDFDFGEAIKSSKRSKRLCVDKGSDKGSSHSIVIDSE